MSAETTSDPRSVTLDFGHGNPDARSETRDAILPRFARILAIGAHPDDESFGLGAVIGALTELGTRTWVLSFTHGEASTLAASSMLGEIRARELAEAAEVLGVQGVRLLAYPDGGLVRTPLEQLVQEVRSFACEVRPDALLVFDSGGITGHPDHCRATEAALAEAARQRIPVLAWAIPGHVAERLNAEFGTTFAGRPRSELDYAIRVDRKLQLAAIAKHGSQSAENPVLWRRLELLGDWEWLRHLNPGSTAECQVPSARLSLL